MNGESNLSEKQKILDDTMNLLSSIAIYNHNYLVKNIVDVDKAEFPFLSVVTGCQKAIADILSTDNAKSLTISEDVVSRLSNLSGYIKILYQELVSERGIDKLEGEEKGLALFELDMTPVLQFGGAIESIVNNIKSYREAAENSLRVRDSAEKSMSAMSWRR